MIFVTGDTHGMEDIYKLTKYFEDESRLHELSKDDYIIICGDVGCVWNVRDDVIVQRTLSDLPVTVLWCDGNHENHDYLRDYDVNVWNGGNVHFITNDIIHLMRGQVFEIDGTTFFTMGGAYSPDKFNRIEGLDWWKEEVPSEMEMKIGVSNLIKHNNCVDYIITHTAPYDVLEELGMEVAYEEERFVSYLESVALSTEFKEWYFGHLHVDEDVENFHALYDRIIKLD